MTRLSTTIAATMIGARSCLVTAPVALAVAGIVLQGCGSLTSPTTVNAAATDANLIATGLASAIASIQALPSLTAGQQATLVQLQGYLATIQKDAAAIAATPSTSTAQEIVSVVQELAPLALSFVPGGSAVAAIVQAALSLAPALLADLGVAGEAMNAAPATYAPDTARLILRGAAAK
jgi:hypothetical protein